VTGP